MNKQLKADLMLLIVTIGWGVSYYFMDVSLQDMGPFTLNMFRFLGAFAVAGILSFGRLKKPTRATVKYSLVVGVLLVAVYSGATFGVMFTSLSNSAFLCALTVVFVPFVEYIMYRKIPKKKMIFVVILCVIGIALLTIREGFSISGKNFIGDMLCVSCAFAYAIDLSITSKAVQRDDVDAYQVGVFQLGVTGVLMMALAFTFEKPHIPGSPKIIAVVIFLSIFCTGIAFIAQAIAQQYTSASHVGVIFTLEPVFAAFVAYFFAGEVLSGKAYIGAVILITALFICELDIEKLKKRD